MKITVIVPQNVTRKPEVGEWVWCANTWNYVNRLSIYTTSDWPIAHGHEIEVPEGDNIVRITSLNDKSTTGNWLGTIPLPRPKVKRWQWVVEMRANQHGAFVPDGWQTEEEIKQQWPDRAYYHKVEETMREFDA